jgi:hypothetical protein
MPQFAIAAAMAGGEVFFFFQLEFDLFGNAAARVGNDPAEARSKRTAVDRVFAARPEDTGNRIPAHKQSLVAGCGRAVSALHRLM